MTVQTAFRLNCDIFKKLKSVSAEEGRTQTWYVNKALGEYFMRNEKGGVKFPTKSKSSAVDNDTADKVIDYLNSQAGTRFKHTDNSRKLINARLKEYTKREAFDVITKKCNEWRGTESGKWLRPSTLFNATKFESYVNEKVIPNGNRPKENTRETPEQRLSRLSREMATKRPAPGHYGEVLDQDGPIASTQVVEHGGSTY